MSGIDLLNNIPRLFSSLLTSSPAPLIRGVQGLRRHSVGRDVSLTDGGTLVRRRLNYTDARRRRQAGQEAVIAGSA